MSDVFPFAPGTAGGMSQISGSYQHGAFPDPFFDLASQAMPETMAYGLRWCEYLISGCNGTYRQALDRVLSYFITDIEVASPIANDLIDDEEKDKYEEFFKNVLGINKTLHSIGMDYLTYGNSFISVLTPFKRYLFCPKCFVEHPLREVYNNPVFNFQWSGYEFHATCASCKYSGIFGHVDRKGKDSDVKIKRWNPHEIEILHDTMTDECEYIWKIPVEYCRQIREGHLFHLERADWDVIQAVKHGKHLRFDKDFVFHLKEEALAGIRSRGWGISRVLANFRQAWYVQILTRYNESIALDYVVPFRVITPVAQGGGGDPVARDPLMNMNMGGFTARVEQMIRQRRRDPASWFSLPFPVQYSTLGGDANKLAPRELLDQGYEMLLNNVGVPAEFFKATMTLQNSPSAIRLFEAGWTHLTYNLNKVLQFVADKLASVFSWQPVAIKLTKVRVAEDLNRSMAILQMALSHNVSQSTGLKSLGLDFKEEVRRMMEEEKFQQEQTSKMQDDLQQAGTMSQMGQLQQPGQDPNAPQDPSQSQGQGQGQGGTQDQQQAAMMQQNADVTSQLPPPDVPMSPSDMYNLASNIANDLLARSSGDRQRQLMLLKQANQTVHDLVVTIMQNIRSQAASQGRQQVMAQNFGQQQQQ